MGAARAMASRNKIKPFGMWELVRQGIKDRSTNFSVTSHPRIGFDTTVLLAHFSQYPYHTFTIRPRTIMQVFTILTMLTSGLLTSANPAPPINLPRSTPVTTGVPVPSAAVRILSFIVGSAVSSVGLPVTHSIISSDAPDPTPGPNPSPGPDPSADPDPSPEPDPSAAPDPEPIGPIPEPTIPNDNALSDALEKIIELVQFMLSLAQLGTGVGSSVNCQLLEQLFPVLFGLLNDAQGAVTSVPR